MMQVPASASAEGPEPSAHVSQCAVRSAGLAGLEAIKHAAGVGALTSGCDGDGQKLRRPDFLRDGLAVGSKT